GDREGPAFIDCVLPFGGSVEQACGFEGGVDRWTDASTVSFVLFGTPDTPLWFEIEGRQGGLWVTETRVAGRLPSRAGERSVLSLGLRARTEPRFSCSTDLPAPEGVLEPSSSAEAQTAIVARDLDGRAGLELLMSVDGQLLVASYRAELEACRLQPTRLADPQEDIDNPFDRNRWCRVVSDSLAVAPLRASGGMVIASLCARPGANGARLKIAVGDMSGANVDIQTINLGVPLSQVSLPIMADIDGTGEYAVFLLVRSSADPEPVPTRLMRYSPLTSEETSVLIGDYEPLPAFGGDIAPSPAPIVIGGPGGGEALLVAGYRGPKVIYDGTRVVDLQQRGARSVRAPVVVERPTLLTLEELQANRSVTTVIQTNAQRTAWAIIETSTNSLQDAVQPSEDVRLSVGLSRLGIPLVAFTNAGSALGWSINDRSSADASRIREVDELWQAASPQLLLHANLDQECGTELITFARDSNSIRAVTVGEQVLPGWPLELTGDTGTRRLLLQDLEPETVVSAPALRTAEVIALTYRRLEVITLGAGSYDPEEWPWPSADGSPVSRGSVLDGPFRRNCAQSDL
ncbi:MAG: hypothetical protein AAFV29_12070, partial [Myxococcota bacterium]